MSSLKSETKSKVEGLTINCRISIWPTLRKMKLSLEKDPLFRNGLLQVTKLVSTALYILVGGPVDLWFSLGYVHCPRS